jgi:uroporphyrin-III C-methyltransferase
VVGFSFFGWSSMLEVNNTIGKVFLIGAGPGDPGLLTIKAAGAIATADVVVYDYLVNPQVLAHSRPEAELIYAGKRAGEHSMSQKEINRLLIRRALGGQTVARLKGGDPFIFGRGGEEAEALAAAEIEWEVIPGISSGVSAAAYSGIPLTHRDYSSSVMFITGHGQQEKGKTINWSAVATTAETLVIFMCAETISQTARKLVAGGRAQSTPIAIVRWGTYEYQELYLGSLASLISAADETPAFSIEPPAIAIIGEVAGLADKLHWFGREASRISKNAEQERIVAVA